MSIQQKTLDIFLLSLFLRVLLSFFLGLHGDEAVFLMGDSNSYIAIAQNLVAHGVYSADSETFAPHNWRTPLYPLFLVPFVWLKDSWFFVVTIQNVLVSFAVAMVYILGRKLFSERVAVGAAILFAIEPTGIFLSNLVLTEALFIFFFLPALLLCALYIREKKKRYLVWSAALFALAALTRPLAYYMIFLIPIVALLAGWKNVPWRTLGAAFVVFYLILSPWLLYNWKTFSLLEFSSTASVNLYYDNVPQFEAWRNPNEDPPLVRERLERIAGVETAGTYASTKKLGQVARQILFDHPFEYAVFHVLYMPRLFIHDGYMDVYERVSGRTVSFSGVSLYHDLIKFHISNLFQSIRETPSILSPYIAKVFFAAIAALAFFHVLIARGREQGVWKISVFFVGFLLLYAFLVSPLGQARLRFVIHPVLFLLALDSMRILKERYAPRFQFLGKLPL